MIGSLLIRPKEKGGCEYLLDGHPIPGVMNYEAQVDRDGITCTLQLLLREVHIDHSAIIQYPTPKKKEHFESEQDIE